METEHLKVEHDGLTFDVKLSGPARGPWVVLLHGFPVDSRCWDDVVPRLHEAGLRTVTFDQRGYSPAARPEHVEDYRLEKLVGDVLGVLGHLNIAYSMIVGHDWGGIVAWHLAAKHPERFTGLVAVSTGHPSAMKEALEAGSDQRERSSYISTFVKPKAEQLLTEDNGVRLTRHGVTPEEVAPLLEPGALTGPLNWYRAMPLNGSGLRAADKITVPTLYVWSDRDIAITAKPARDTANYVSGPYRFETLHGASHWLPEEKPTEIADMLLQWFATHPV